MRSTNSVLRPVLRSEPAPLVEEDMTPTQKLWNPISQLQDVHAQAILDLSAAVGRGDEVGMKTAYDTIMWVQDEQKKAHGDVREYQREKSARRVNG